MFGDIHGRRQRCWTFVDTLTSGRMQQSSNHPANPGAFGKRHPRGFGGEGFDALS